MLMLRAFLVISAFAALFVIEYQPTWLSKPTVDVYGNPDLSNKDGVLHFKGEPYTGITIERFPKGNISKSTEYKEGIQHGITEEYGFTGALRNRFNYVNGVKEGLQYSWYLEGPQKSVHNFKNGLLHGLSTEYFISGQLFRKREFNSGVEVSSKVHFFTGELHTNYVKRDGAIYGLKTGDLCMDFKKDGEL